MNQPDTIQEQIETVVKAANTIPGMMWPREIGGLYRQVMQSRVHVEVGTFCGKSLYITAAAMNGGSIIAVDPLSEEFYPNLKEFVPDMIWNRKVLSATIDVIHRKFDTKVELWRMSSIDAVKQAFNLGLRFDSCFIDANHGKAECMADIVGWSELVKQGGKILGHDYFPNFIGVMDAVNEFFVNDFQQIPETRIWLHNKK